MVHVTKLTDKLNWTAQGSNKSGTIMHWIVSSNFQEVSL